MAKLIGSSGSIWSFEPFPANYDLLVRNIKENGVESVVHPKPLAAHDQRDESSLYFRADAMNDNFGSMFVSDRAQDGPLTRCSVSRVRIDDMLPKDLPIHFVKMDIEGAEIQALRGMSGIIERFHPTIVVELNELALNRGNSSTPEELIQLLKAYGYNVSQIGSNRELRCRQIERMIS